MRRLVATLGAAAVLAALVALASPSASAAPPDHSAAAEHRRVNEYWTQARRDSAVPRDIRPNARPPGSGGGGGGGGGTVTGSTWTGGGDVVLVVGKVFFTLGGVDYVCSGSAVDSAIGSVVLTAGHCVHEGPGAFATNWEFCPAYNNAPHAVLDCWTARDLYTTSAWGGDGDFDDDTGFAVVHNGSATTLEGALQSAGAVHIPAIQFAQAGGTTTYSAFGYPAAGKFKGQKLTYCRAPLTGELDNQPGTQSIRCDMTVGSSGGPWYSTFDETAPYVVTSLNSYGYSSLKGYMFGPIFGTGEAAAFNGAGTGDCTGSPSQYRCVDLGA